MSKKVNESQELPKDVDFDMLVGETASLYPSANNLYQFQLGQVLFEVIEDENDGYRSSMQTVRIVRAIQTISRPLAQVTISKSELGSENIYLLTDERDNHVWLRFGTDNADDWYPRFVFDWRPKVPESIKRLKQLIK